MVMLMVMVMLMMMMGKDTAVYFVAIFGYQYQFHAEFLVQEIVRVLRWAR